MNELRTAAQQALEVLEDWDSPVSLPAITALRTALAQEQAEPAQPAPLKRGITGRCARKVCECEKEGLGPECIYLEPMVDGYPLWSGIPKTEPVEPVAHRVVAGALFDFMGWLTSRRERLVLSSTDDAAPAADAIKDFAEMRGLSLDDAKVQDWNAALAQQAEPFTAAEIVRMNEAWLHRRALGLNEQAEPVAWLYTGIKQDGTEHGPHLVWKPEYMDAMSASKGAKATPLYTTLRAALAQQAEPVEPVAWRYKGEPWFDGTRWHDKYEATTDERVATFKDKRAQPLYTASPRQSDPQIEDRLARHGINPCPDCRGIGYDASGQLCWCQQNPSF